MQNFSNWYGSAAKLKDAYSYLIGFFSAVQSVLGFGALICRADDRSLRFCGSPRQVQAQRDPLTPILTCCFSLAYIYHLRK